MTPAGQETRLTKGMKDYYLRKARSKGDLPTWLFSAEERQGGRDDFDEISSMVDRRDRVYRDRARAIRGVKTDDYAPLASSRNRRGLRDVYEEASVASEPVISSGRRGRDYQSEDEVGSKAASRLKAMRDAKRPVRQDTFMDLEEEPEDRYSRRRGGRIVESDQARDLPAPPLPPRRVAVGLPAGPNGNGPRPPRPPRYR